MMITETQKKRVYTLYRVSTKQQLNKASTGNAERDKYDIPMQRTECHKFIDQRPEWELVCEYEEKGVSGFKKSAKDRDAIQELQQAALENKFDVLLVYMFDRIGRIESETPFVVEWFVENNIEVWSTQEGQQRFDTHVDNLMNYLRFWQAAGESKKTSARVKTRMGQMAEEGLFRGGSVPFGYKLQKRGRINNKGHEVYDMVIDEDESPIVKIIFDKYINRGYGTQRISTYLYENGYKNRSGDSFVNCTINNMLKNETYTGIIKSGETKSDIIPELQIITPDTFERAQDIMRQRSQKYAERNVPYHTKGKSLLSGNVYCGHCGSRLVQTSSVKRNRNADGSMGREYIRIRYVCYNKTRHKNSCDGQTGYTVSKLDNVIDEIIHGIFDRAKRQPAQLVLGARYEEQIKAIKARMNAASKTLKKRQKEYDDYKAEMLLVIRGESVFDRETLNELMMESKAAVDEADATIKSCAAEIEDGESIFNKLSDAHEQLLSWADMYDTSDLEVRKMITSQLIKQVRVKRNYEIEIEFHISYQDYATGGELSDNEPYKTTA